MALGLGGAGIVLGDAGGSEADAIRVDAAIVDWRWAPRAELPAATGEREEAATEEPASEQPAEEDAAAAPRTESLEDLEEDVP